MLIIPARPRRRILPPLRTAEWRTSQAQAKNAFGHENQTRFSITARLHDGHVAWRGWFDDRDDCNAFLWALATDTLVADRELWDLPTPAWHPDVGFGAPLQYTFATVAFIVSGASWAVPSDCIGVTGQSGEFIDTVGAGASGGCGRPTGQGRACGSGGGGWSRVTSLSLSPSGSVPIQVGVGGASITNTTTVFTTGNAGTDTWFNGANLPASSVGAKGGLGGTASNGSAVTPGAGGDAASGVGTSKTSGGSGGGVTATGNSSGGGGAGGPNGNGVASPNATTSYGTPSAGGAGDAGLGGAGSGGHATTSSAGSPGTEYDATHGCGGGSGGVYQIGSTAATSGNAGEYGAGAGGCSTNSGGTSKSGKGGEGLIVVAYVPYVQPTTPRMFDIHRRRRV